MLRLSADPNRWISVTAPLRAVLRVNPAFLIRCVDMRYTMPSTWPTGSWRTGNATDT